MSLILLPCPPRKSCGVCEARLFNGERDPLKKASKYRHQAEQHGLEAARLAVFAAGNVDEAVSAAVLAATYADMYLRMVEATR